MILADKIIDLRKKNGWSQEELAERLNVSRQSVSKWESGMSIPDLNKIIAMSELFGVSTDYLVKDTLDAPTPSESASTDDPCDARPVSAEEANRYLETVERASRRIALGVMLCILSPILLIVLGGLSDADVMAGAPLLGEGAAAAIGLMVLLMMIAYAVTLFITWGMRLEEFSYLEKERIAPAYGVQGIVEKKMTEHAPRFTAHITVGVVMCIFSPLPLLILGATGAAEMVLVGSIGFLLAVCAVAVYIMVRACYIRGSYQRLLQTGDYTPEKKQRDGGAGEAIQSAYWCLMTGVYLLWSFLSGDWHITWILWLFAAAGSGLIELLTNRRK